MRDLLDITYVLSVDELVGPTMSKGMARARVDHLLLPPEIREARESNLAMAQLGAATQLPMAGRR